MRKANKKFLALFKSALISYNKIVPDFYRIPSHLEPYYVWKDYLWIKESFEAHRHSLMETVNGNSFDLPKSEFDLDRSDFIDNTIPDAYLAYNEVMEWVIAFNLVYDLIYAHVCLVRADANRFKRREYLDKMITVLSDGNLLMLLDIDEVAEVLQTVRNIGMKSWCVLKVNCNWTMNNTMQELFYKET